MNSRTAANVSLKENKIDSQILTLEFQDPSSHGGDMSFNVACKNAHDNNLMEKSIHELTNSSNQMNINSALPKFGNIMEQSNNLNTESLEDSPYSAK